MNGEELLNKQIEEIKKKLAHSLFTHDMRESRKIIEALAPRLKNESNNIVSEFSKMYNTYRVMSEEEMLTKIDDFVQTCLSTMEYDLVDKHIDIERRKKDLQGPYFPETKERLSEELAQIENEYNDIITRLSSLTGETYVNGNDAINKLGLSEDLNNNINNGDFDKTRIERLTNRMYRQSDVIKTPLDEFIFSKYYSTYYQIYNESLRTSMDGIKIEELEKELKEEILSDDLKEEKTKELETLKEKNKVRQEKLEELVSNLATMMAYVDDKHVLDLNGYDVFVNTKDIDKQKTFNVVMDTKKNILKTYKKFARDFHNARLSSFNDALGQVLKLEDPSIDSSEEKKILEDLVKFDEEISNTFGVNSFLLEPEIAKEINNINPSLIPAVLKSRGLEGVSKFGEVKIVKPVVKEDSKEELKEKEDLKEKKRRERQEEKERKRKERAELKEKRRKEKETRNLMKKASRELRKGKMNGDPSPVIEETPHNIEIKPRDDNEIIIEVEKVDEKDKTPITDTSKDKQKNKPSSKAVGLYDQLGETNQNIYDSMMKKSFTKAINSLSSEQLDYMYGLLKYEVNRIKNHCQENNIPISSLGENDIKIIALYTKVRNKHIKVFGKDENSNEHNNISEEARNQAMDTLLDKADKVKIKKGGR